MSFIEFDQLVPVHSLIYPTYPLEYPVPEPTDPATQQTIQLDTIDLYGGFWSELLFLNRSPETIQIFFDPKQPRAFFGPAESKISLEGWGRYIKIISGLSGFGEESNMHLTITRRADALRSSYAQYNNASY